MTKSNDCIVVEELFLQAQVSAGLRDWCSVEQAYLRALKMDVTPATRIAYGVFLAEQERYFEAISVFTPILDGHDRAAIAAVCHNLAAIYRTVGDADLARRFQWRATLLQDDADERDLLGMANNALVMRQPEVAEALVMSACELMDSEIEDCADGDYIATMGLAYATEGFSKQALLTLYRAYLRHQSAKDYRGMGADLMNMSLLFGELRRHRTERNCILRAIRCFEKAPAPRSLSNARVQLKHLDRMESVRQFDVRRN